MSIIEKINSSADIKALDSFELRKLADELREFEVQSIAKTGGHLASNLGTVELTLALHRVYDTEKDRLVFDVPRVYGSKTTSRFILSIYAVSLLTLPQSTASSFEKNPARAR